MAESPVVAIDGPAGSGKSSTAKAVAERLGLPHLDSGALYRAVTVAGLDAGGDLSGQRLLALAQALPVRLALAEDGFHPEVAGADVSRAIRDGRVNRRVSEVAAMPEVRDWVNGLLREAVRRHPRGAVLDGRDIGTVVFPDAALKVYLTAAPRERARRRLTQEGKEPAEDALHEATRDLERRDAADAARAVAPLRRAPDAVELDTTRMSFDEQVDAIVRLARKVFGIA